MTRVSTRLPHAQFRDDVLGIIDITPTVHPRLRYPWDAPEYNVWTRDGLCGMTTREGSKWSAYPTNPSATKRLFPTRKAAARYLADVRRSWAADWSRKLADSIEEGR